VIKWREYQKKVGLGTTLRIIPLFDGLPMHSFCMGNSLGGLIHIGYPP